MDGDLHGTVTDDAGSALPGATATLTGQRQPQVQTTDAQGEFAFINLPVGPYELKVELAGFKPFSTEVFIIENPSVTLFIALYVDTLE